MQTRAELLVEQLNGNLKTYLVGFRYDQKPLERIFRSGQSRVWLHCFALYPCTPLVVLSAADITREELLLIVNSAMEPQPIYDSADLKQFKAVVYLYKIRMSPVSAWLPCVRRRPRPHRS